MIDVQVFSYSKMYIYTLCDNFELHTLYFEVPDSLVSHFVFIEHPLAIRDSVETVFGWWILGTSFPAAAACTAAMVIIFMGRTWAGSINIIVPN